MNNGFYILLIALASLLMGLATALMALTWYMTPIFPLLSGALVVCALVMVGWGAYGLYPKERI